MPYEPQAATLKHPADAVQLLSNLKDGAVLRPEDAVRHFLNQTVDTPQHPSNQTADAPQHSSNQTDAIVQHPEDAVQHASQHADQLILPPPKYVG